MGDAIRKATFTVQCDTCGKKLWPIRMVSARPFDSFTEDARRSMALSLRWHEKDHHPELYKQDIGD